jgi:hypothetical protein
MEQSGFIDYVRSWQLSTAICSGVNDIDQHIRNNRRIAIHEISTKMTPSQSKKPCSNCLMTNTEAFILVAEETFVPLDHIH